MDRSKEEIKIKIKSLITIPQYFKKYIDDSIDLNRTPKIPSPFRKETNPSFSYSLSRDIWKDFGGDKLGGDVIALHKAWNKFGTYDEALLSLASILGIKVKIKKEIQLKPVKLGEVGVLEKFKLLNKKIESKIRTRDDPELYAEYDNIMIMDLTLNTKYELMEKFYESVC